MRFEKIEFEVDEKIVVSVHRHWLTLFTSLFSLWTFALVPLVSWLILLTFEKSYDTFLVIDFSSYGTHFTYFYCLWLLWVSMAVAYVLMNHYLDTWTITNRRVIVIDQQGFFRRHIGSFRLERLQDVNVEINGLVATLLDYGTLEAETAGHGEGEFRAHFLPHPRELKAAILSATDPTTNIK